MKFRNVVFISIIFLSTIFHSYPDNLKVDNNIIKETIEKKNPYVDKRGINMEYSFKVFHNQDLSKLPASEIDNSIIKGSSFFQDPEITKGERISILPKNPIPHDVEFRDCNVIGVLIDETTCKNCTTTGTTRNYRLKVIEDKEGVKQDWILNEKGEPLILIKELNKEKTEYEE